MILKSIICDAVKSTSEDNNLKLVPESAFSVENPEHVAMMLVAVILTITIFVNHAVAVMAITVPAQG